MNEGNKAPPLLLVSFFLFCVFLKRLKTEVENATNPKNEHFQHHFSHQATTLSWCGLILSVWDSNPDWATTHCSEARWFSRGPSVNPVWLWMRTSPLRSRIKKWAGGSLGNAIERWLLCGEDWAKIKQNLMEGTRCVVMFQSTALSWAQSAVPESWRAPSSCVPNGSFNTNRPLDLPSSHIQKEETP